MLNQAGFTLLEILVAVVIMSMGLLGLAGLQAASLRNNQSAYFRGIAAQQVYDMADRIRANRVGVAAGNYDNLNNAAALTDPQCFTAGCTAADMATTDYLQWDTNNSDLLPGGVGTVTCVQGPGANCNNTPGALRVFRIVVRWPQAGTDCRDENGVLLFANTDCFLAEVSP